MVLLFWFEETFKKYAIFLKNKAHIKLRIFIDGVEGDKSTGLIHWPILGKILEVDVNIIFPIALHTGYDKPKCVESYLRQFVDESNKLHLEGILIDNQRYEFSITRIVGDAPARVMFLNIIGYTAFGHCLYCHVTGKRLHFRNYFYDDVAPLKRNREEFFNLGYMPQLQNGPTPLMDLEDFDIMEDCPYDPMHMFVGAAS